MKYLKSQNSQKVITISNFIIKSSLRKRDNLIKMMNDKGFSARPVWKPLHKLKHLKTCPKMNLTVTEDLEARIINLPSSAYLANHKF